MHLLNDFWQFSFRITEKATRTSSEKPQLTRETHFVYLGYTLLVYSTFLWPALKTVLGIFLRNSSKLPLN